MGKVPNRRFLLHSTATAGEARSTQQKTARRRLFVPLQLSLAPMMHLGIGVEGDHNVTIERLHECDSRKQRMTFANAQHQCFDRYLPVCQVRLLFWQRLNVVGRIPQREQLPAVGQNNRIFKTRRPRHKNLLLKIEWRGCHTGSAATPGRAAHRLGLIAICATEVTLNVLSPAATELTS